MTSNNVQSADALTQWLLRQAVEGLPILDSAPKLAQRYREDMSYSDNEARAVALVRWESSKSFATGFITGLAGFLTMLVALPAGMGAAWVLQARMVAALADLRGYDVEDPWVQTAVLMSLAGTSTPESLKRMGIQAGEWAAKRLIGRLSESTMQQINRRVGFRLLATATERGALKLGRAIPVAGAVLAGAVEAYDCHAVARHANRLLVPR